jgi:hypothetical protein
VDRVGSGKARQVNARFLAMTSHYVFEPEFCNPAAGWEKGQVEKNVQDARHLVLHLMPDFPDLAALNAWLEQRCIELWERRPHGTLPGTIAEVWHAERTALMPPPPAFDGFVEQSKRVSPTCLISFERNRYSVPASFANRPVSLRVYPDRLVVAAEGQIVCEHPRVIQRSHKLPPRTIYDWRHYLAVIQRKPGALRSEPWCRHRFETHGERAFCPVARGFPDAPASSAQTPGRRQGDGGDPCPGASAR